tara:strand:- start:903 stop:1631 length:729 start_codon:yes stop_codon:yes gene_type:complete
VRNQREELKATLERDPEALEHAKNLLPVRDLYKQGLIVCAHASGHPVIVDAHSSSRGMRVYTDYGHIMPLSGVFSTFLCPMGWQGFLHNALVSAYTGGYGSTPHLTASYHGPLYVIMAYAVDLSAPRGALFPGGPSQRDVLIMAEGKPDRWGKMNNSIVHGKFIFGIYDSRTGTWAFNEDFEPHRPTAAGLKMQENLMAPQSHDPLGRNYVRPWGPPRKPERTISLTAPPNEVWDVEDDSEE